MLNTYIKNRGTTQTIIHNNNKNHFNEINWDADYDGKLANISINYNTDGMRDRVNLTLDNDDLANILNVQSVNTPLDKRLKNDFEYDLLRDPESYYIELPELSIEPMKPRKPKKTHHISSISPNEELIIPITIDRKKRHKTHVTHKVYKKPKSHSRRHSKRHSKSHSKSHSRRHSRSHSRSRSKSKKSSSMPILSLL